MTNTKHEPLPGKRWLQNTLCDRKKVKKFERSTVLVCFCICWMLKASLCNTSHGPRNLLIVKKMQNSSDIVLCLTLKLD